MVVSFLGFSQVWLRKQPPIQMLKRLATSKPLPSESGATSRSPSANSSSTRWANDEAANPNIRCQGIVNSRKVEFSASSAYIEYCMQMRHGESVWVFWRRYSEWLCLKRRMEAVSRSSTAVRAPLPRKRMVRHAKSELIVTERADGLTSWMNAVLKEADDAVLSSHYFLTFVGLISATPAESSRPLPIHFSMLNTIAESGDVVLFRTKAAVPALQVRPTLLTHVAPHAARRATPFCAAPRHTAPGHAARTALHARHATRNPTRSRWALQSAPSPPDDAASGHQQLLGSRGHSGLHGSHVAGLLCCRLL